MDECADFSNRFIRGIINEQYVSEDGYPLGSLYHFRFSVPGNRTDNFKEESINWDDDENALRHIILQKKKDTIKPQFSYGAAITDLSIIEALARNKRYKDIFCYERKPIDGNDYHGNLLFSASASKIAMLQLADCIAGQTYIVIKRDEYLQSNEIDPQ